MRSRGTKGISVAVNVMVASRITLKKWKVIVRVAILLKRQRPLITTHV
jgi:hypothetical protein